MVSGQKSQRRSRPPQNREQHLLLGRRKSHYSYLTKEVDRLASGQNLINVLAIPVLEVKANTEEGEEDAQCSQRVVEHCQWEGDPVDNGSDRRMFITCSIVSMNFFKFQG